MKLFVGLGNPGNEYENNRHNIGFMFIEFLANKLDSSSQFNRNSKFAANVSEVTKNGEKYLFVEPQTYMNRSGEPLSRLVNFYKVKPEDIFVVHDDLDIPIEKFKIQNGTGPKLHGGLASIEQLLGTPDFWRVRIGVENRGEDNRLSGEDYVLQNFSSEENQLLLPLFEKIYQQLRLQKVINEN